jgi:hypothetical protein
LRPSTVPFGGKIERGAQTTENRGGSAMGTKKTATRKNNDVTLVRLGVGSQSYSLPAGASVADLLRAAGASSRDQEVYVDGKKIEDLLMLKPGAIVTVVPRPKIVASSGSWRDTVGMVTDDAAFQAIIDAGRAIREADEDAS